MREEGPSRTAIAVAYRRALHQRIDDPPVFLDPFAERILPERTRARLDDPESIRRQRVSAPLRAFLALRSRVAEDRVATAHALGVRQYLVLGAGLDTFALRNPHPGLVVFEVDHPRTQEWKRKRLREAGLESRGTTAYVPVDFERDDPGVALAAHGFRPGAGCAISWLGVVPYLTLPAILTTLRWAAGVIGEHGHIVFDYGSPPRWWQVGQRLSLRWLAARVAAQGEPFRTRFPPPVLRRHLEEVGLATVEDLDGPALGRLHLAGRRDGLAVPATAHVVIASPSLLSGPTAGGTVHERLMDRPSRGASASPFRP